MPAIELEKSAKDMLVTRIQKYFHDELQQDIGRFEAEFLMDFFGENLGVLYYNQAVRDVQAQLQKQLEEVAYGIGELEQALPKGLY
jgi:uncharacterized protein (DUF2164 family)